MTLLKENNSIILLVGVSGSGKSTWGEKFAADNNINYLSSDKLRAEVGSGENDQTVTPLVFSLLKVKVDELLYKGKSVMVDATNLNRRDRKDFLDIANRYGTFKIAVVFELSREELVGRQEKRSSSGGRRVPDDVIDRMIKKYQKPDNTEFDRIIFK